MAAALVVSAGDRDGVTLERVRADGKAIMAPYKLPKVLYAHTRARLRARTRAQIFSPAPFPRFSLF